MNYYLFKPFFVLPYFDPITPSLKTSTPPPHLKHSPPPHHLSLASGSTSSPQLLPSIKCPKFVKNAPRSEIEN